MSSVLPLGLGIYTIEQALISLLHDCIVKSFRQEAQISVIVCHQQMRVV